MGGLGQKMEQSLAIFMKGTNKGVAEVLPSSGSHPLTASTSLGEPKGGSWVYLTSILRLASVPARDEPAVFPALRSRHEGCPFISPSQPLALDSKHLHKLQAPYLLPLCCGRKGVCALRVPVDSVPGSLPWSPVPGPRASWDSREWAAS